MKNATATTRKNVSYDFENPTELMGMHMCISVDENHIEYSEFGTVVDIVDGTVRFVVMNDLVRIPVESVKEDLATGKAILIKPPVPYAIIDSDSIPR